MKALKEEIGTAERIQKKLLEEVKEQNQVKDKKRVTENELQNMEKFSYFVNRLFVQMYDILYKLKPHCENVRLFI